MTSTTEIVVTPDMVQSPAENSTLRKVIVNVAGYKTPDQIKELSDDARASFYKSVSERVAAADAKIGTGIEELAVTIAIAYAGNVPAGMDMTWQEYISEFAPLLADGTVKPNRQFVSAFYVALHKIMGEPKKVPGARKVHAAIGEALGLSLPSFSNGLRDARETDLPASDRAAARKAAEDAKRKAEAAAAKELAAKLEKAKATNAEVNGTPAGETSDDESADDESSPSVKVINPDGQPVTLNTAPLNVPDTLAGEPAIGEGPATVTTDAGEFVTLHIAAADMEKALRVLRASGIAFEELATVTA
jgi:hypothetical protein